MPHGSATTLAANEHEKTQTSLNNSGIKSTVEEDGISDDNNKKEDTISKQTEIFLTKSPVIKEHVDNEISNSNIDDTLNNKVNGNTKDTESGVENHMQSNNNYDSNTLSTCEMSSPDDSNIRSDQGCNLSTSKDPEINKIEKDSSKVRSPNEASSSTELGPSTSRASKISSTTSNINAIRKKAYGKKKFRKSDVKSRNRIGFCRQSSGNSRMLSRYFADDLEIPVGDLAPWDDEGIETDPETIDKHPYQKVLDNLRMPEHMKKYEYFKVKPWFKTPCIIVATKTFFLKVLENLSRQKIIGVTIKVNSASYYSTRICLLQISTRRRNYLIDAIELNASLPLLNNIFANPKVVKVIYGSKNFFKSFQVGHNIWFVNVFDIRLAMGRLGWKNMSFRQLVEINFHVDWFEGNMLKWQKRPLQKEYRVNATISVHYLLPVYLLLKNELSKTIENKKLLGLVFKDSNDQCAVVFKQRNIESLFPELRYLEPSRAYAVHELERWRQHKGRRKNKNVNHLLNLKDFKELIKNMPTNREEIIRITNSEFVKKHIDEVQKIMLEASNVIGPVCSMFEDVKPATLTKLGDENVKLLESLKAAENVKPLENKRNGNSVKNVKAAENVKPPENKRNGKSVKNVKAAENVKVFKNMQGNVESVGKVNLLENVKVVKTRENANSHERVKPFENENVKAIQNVRENVKSVKNMNVSGNVDSRNGVVKKRLGNRVLFTQNNIEEKLTINNSHANNIEKLHNLTLIDRAAKKTNKNPCVQNKSSYSGVKNYPQENVCNQKNRDTSYVHKNTRNQRYEAKNYIYENSVTQKNKVMSHINENINKRNIAKSVMQNNTSDHIKEIKTNTSRNIGNQKKERISAHENINNQNKNTTNNNKVRTLEKTQNKYRNGDEQVPNTNTDMKKQPITSGPSSVGSTANCQVYNVISKRPVTDRSLNQNHFQPQFWGHPNGEVQNWCPPVMLYQPYYDYPETYMSMSPANMGYVHESGYSNQYDTDCSIHQTSYDDGRAYGYGVQYSYVPSRCLYHSGLDVRHPDRSMHKST